MSFQVWFLVYSSFALLSFFSVRSETFQGKSFTKTKIYFFILLHWVVSKMRSMYDTGRKVRTCTLF